METVTGTTPGLFDAENGGGCRACSGRSSCSCISCSSCGGLSSCQSCWYCTYPRISIQRPKSRFAIQRGGETTSKQGSCAEDICHLDVVLVPSLSELILSRS